MSGSNNTEDSIINNIPDFQEEPAGSTPSADNQQTDSQGSSNEGRSSAQPTQEGQTESAEAKQPPIRRRHDGLLERANPENPNTRDLVDPISGRVVARGGIERKIYEDGQRASRENNALKQKVQGYENQLRATNEVAQRAAQLGVAPQDQVIAIQLMSEFMKDPVTTLGKLVEEVKSKGYQIPFLEQGVSPGMDLSAISRMIDGKLAPLTQQQQAAMEAEHYKRQAESDLQNFLSENDEANANLDVLAEMLQAQPSLSLGNAYTKMIRWAHDNGLDWTQPLKPQIAGIQEQRQQQHTTQQPNRPLPNGRSAATGGATRMNGGSGGAPMSENSSWSDIIRSAMEESGTRLN
jgi:hypothetical protein